MVGGVELWLLKVQKKRNLQYFQPDRLTDMFVDCTSCPEIKVVNPGTSDVVSYAKQLKEIGVEYVGLCCGNCPKYTRTLAMEYGRRPAAAK